MNAARIELLKKYIAEEPSNPFNKYALAMEYYEVEPSKSLALLQAILSEHPEYLPSYFKAAHLLWEEELWKKADAVFQKGIALANDQSDQKALGELKSAYQNFQIDKD
ncbi:tetratricopeptide repeat protein [Ekhidna sp. To15]|uniref:tetratricopeptide repeat protein n=1 Tax=Ekhidna sp. To15 TaxID=3395267 RepID=UPI003F523395